MVDNGFSPSPTGAGLIAFLDYAIDKGYVNRSTGQSMKSAVREVLSSTQGDDTWESFDLTSFDEDDLLQRFETLRAMKYSSGTLTAYRGRFSKAVGMFAEFRASPANWRPAAKPRRRRSSENPPAAGATTSPATSHAQTRSNSSAPAEVSHQGPGPMITYPFPLRPGILASLALPPDLTRAEAVRLAAFVESLAVENPQQPARAELKSGNG